MTTAKNVKVQALTTAAVSVDFVAEFYDALPTTTYNKHSCFFIMNLSVVAAEIAWMRWDGTVAVAGVNDNVPLRPGERLRLPNDVSVLSIIAASGTPSVAIVGDQSTLQYI